MLFSRLLIFGLISLAFSSKSDSSLMHLPDSLISVLVDDISSPAEPFILKSEDVLPDSSYSPRIVTLATKKALAEFITTAAMMNSSTPLTDFVFKDIFSLLKKSMKLNVDKIKVPVTKNLLTEMTKTCVAHMVRGDDSTVSKKERLQRQGTANLVKILVYECYTLNVCAIPERSALILFEFLYRFAIEDARYTVAFHELQSSINPEAVPIMFDKIIKYFDPKRQALPVFIMRSENRREINEDEIKFIQDFYKRVIELLDPEDDEVSYCRHVNMIISSIISFSPIDALTPILIETLPHVEPVGLLTSSQFIKNALTAIPKAIKENRLLLTYFLDTLLNDDLISRLPEPFYAGFGAIMNLFESYSYDPISAYIRKLSNASKAKILQLRFSFNRYATYVSRIESYKYLRVTFNGMQKKDLIVLRQEIDELSDDFTSVCKPIYVNFWDSIAEVSKALDDLLKMTDTIEDTKEEKESDAKKEMFYFEKFKVFQSFLNFIIKNEDRYSDNIRALFIKILSFFSNKVFSYPKNDKFMETFKYQLNFILIKSRIMPNSFSLKIIHNFLHRVLRFSASIIEINSIYVQLLNQSSAFDENMANVVFMADSIRITATPAIVQYFQKEMIKFAKLFKSDENLKYLSAYDRLLKFKNYLISSKRLNKTELILIEKYMQKYLIK